MLRPSSASKARSTHSVLHPGGMVHLFPAPDLNQPRPMESDLGPKGCAKTTNPEIRAVQLDAKAEKADPRPPGQDANSLEYVEVQHTCLLCITAASS